MALIIKGDITKLVEAKLSQELKIAKDAAIKRAVEQIEAELREKMVDWALDVNKYYSIEKMGEDVVVTVRGVLL